jgi:hypothetical protein
VREDAGNAPTAERLLRWYLGELLDPAVDLTTISAQLAGIRPASIKEVASKAILGAARRLSSIPDSLTGIVNDDDLNLAVRVSREQLELAQPLEEVMKADSEEERAAVFLGQAIERAAGLVADRISETTLRIARQQLGAALPPATSNGHGPKIEHLPTLEIEEVP